MKPYVYLNRKSVTERNNVWDFKNANVYKNDPGRKST